uniref:TACC_C domain-containing protein n=1 Tax=Syphacia muris TaxID=451379 RepID=A0A0N5B0D8_9BILA
MSDTYIDNFEELLKLCDDFMQTAIGVNGNLASSSWLQSLNDYKQFSEDIMKSRSRWQKSQESALSEMQQTQDMLAFEKENISIKEKELSDATEMLQAAKKEFNAALDEERRMLEKINNLSNNLKNAELKFHSKCLEEACKERDRLVELKSLTNNKKTEMERILLELDEFGGKFGKI